MKCCWKRITYLSVGLSHLAKQLNCIFFICKFYTMAVRPSVCPVIPVLPSEANRFVQNP